MKVIIFSTYRTGSMMLLSFLDSCLQIKSYGEKSSKFLNKMSDYSMVSIKYDFWKQKTLPDIRQYKIIHLIRKDLLKLTLSNIMNDNKGNYKRPGHIFTAQEKRSLTSKNFKITINPNLLLSKMEFLGLEVISWYKKLQAISIPLYYEDLTEDKDIHIMPKPITVKILKFIGIRYQKLITGLYKVNDNYESYIENWDEIKNIGIEYRQAYLTAIGIRNV